MDSLQGNYRRKQFLKKLVTELADPHIRSRQKRGVSNAADSSDGILQTKFCEVKQKCKKNRSVGNCLICQESLFGQYTAINERR